MGLAPYGQPRFVDRIVGTMVEVEGRRVDLDGHVVLQLLPGPDDDVGEVPQLFGGPPRRPESADHANGRWTSRLRFRKSPKTSCSRPPGTCTRKPGCKSVPGRRCRAQLRGQWAHPARRAVREHLGAAGRRRCRRSAGRGAACLASAARRAAPAAAGDSMHGSLLGPARDRRRYQIVSRRRKMRATPSIQTTRSLSEAVADLMAREQVVGWFQGRMEFGPRALGARSIIGDARSPSLQSTMNLKIKFRESFRPFAPVVLKERVRGLFRDAAGDRQPIHAAGGAGARAIGGRRSTVNSRRASIKRQDGAFGNPGGDARGLLGAGANRRRRAATAASTSWSRRSSERPVVP